MTKHEPLHEAILLLGPSGVGKSPLGELLEQRGLNGRSCAHFDFGAQLRRLVAKNEPNEWLSKEDIFFLREVLETGALLEEERLPLATSILRTFLADREVERSTLVVMNGLPRHLGQVVVLKSVLTVVAVVYLRCDERAIHERIVSNVGGDRLGRQDDEPAKVSARFQTFVKRTTLLVDHYRKQGAAIKIVDVTPSMRPDEVYATLGL